MKFLEDYTAEADKTICIPGHKMNRPIVGHNPLNDIGMELEIEGETLPTEGHLASIRSKETAAVWAVHRDGSLRGEALEYVLSSPVKPSELEEMLKALWDKFSSLGTRMRLSNRCSTHVHVNVSGYKINEITSVIALWTTLEEVLINWCGLDRTTNHFCLPSSQSSTVIRAWGRFLENGALDFPEGMKYSALNLRPIMNFGSVEFRTMRASLTYEPLLDWALFCHALVRYAKERYQIPSLISNELSERTGTEIFMEICDRAGTSSVFRDSVLSHPFNDNFNDKCMQGFRRAQPLIGMFPWERWHPLIDKEYIQNPFVDEGMEDNPAPRFRAPPPDEIREIGNFLTGDDIHATHTRVSLPRATRGSFPHGL